MSKEAGKDKKPQGGPPSNVVELPKRCPAEGCGKKPVRSAFCSEHFEWFKAGLINRQGQRPKDFDKKYQAWSQKRKVA
ncbi:MAG: hypothetical protein KDD61_03075 [Bdellovibrionales bacterium]|nr:hypothetical protein [Bdellovibrionales bacterium]